MPQACAEIVTAVRSSVPRYDPAAPDGVDAPVAEAARSALDQFLDAVDGAPHRDRRTDELFRSLGSAEAAAGHSLVDLRAALHVGASLSWHQLRMADEDDAVAADLRSRLADPLFAFVAHLERQAQEGFEARRRRLADDRGWQRVRLVEQLLTGTPTDLDAERAWPVPTQVLVALAELVDGERPDLGPLARRTLVARDSERLVVLAEPDDRPLVERTLLAAVSGRVVLAWAVDRVAIPQAFAWTRRALDLVARGVITGSRVLDLEDHRVQLWLHGEPALRQRLCQELLGPLLEETPNSREILSETLLTWLETRESAPVIAARLGVHPQTVRYRWKRINEIFGDVLRDPDRVVELTMALKASIPLWAAGDQSDLERYRADSR